MCTFIFTHCTYGDHGVFSCKLFFDAERFRYDVSRCTYDAERFTSTECTSTEKTFRASASKADLSSKTSIDHAATFFVLQ